VTRSRLVIRRHQVRPQSARLTVDWLQVWRPCLQLLLGIVEDLAGFADVRERLAYIAWNNWSVIKVVQEASPVLGEDDLLLGTLDGCGEMEVVGFLELLACLNMLAWNLSKEWMDSQY
jgi:hypothetical protein